MSLDSQTGLVVLIRLQEEGRMSLEIQAVVSQELAKMALDGQTRLLILTRLQE